MENDEKLYEGMSEGDEVREGTPSSGDDACPACGGTGKAPEGGTCPVCDGTGYVVDAVGGG